MQEPTTLAPPPSTNRGVEITDHARNGPVTAGIGWLDGSAKWPIADEVRRVIGARFGDEFEVPASGFYGAALGYRDGVARVEWNGHGDAAGTTRVEVKQGGLDRLGL